MRGPDGGCATLTDPVGLRGCMTGFIEALRQCLIEDDQDRWGDLDLDGPTAN